MKKYALNDLVSLADIIFDFDSKSQANVYHVNVCYPLGDCALACSDFHKAVAKLCHIDLVAASGDYATRFVIVSHLSPSQFEKCVSKSFLRFRHNRQFNIIF